MQWCPEGLICAPWLASTQVTLAAMRRCPLPLSTITPPTQVPDTVARLVSGWYRRSELHAPAPAGLPELIQATGEGFGGHDHPTTSMCLAALPWLPPGDALDIGCGSGLLTQAWLTLGKGSVHAIDADPAAVTQTSRSLGHLSVAAGRRWTATVRRIEHLAPHDLANVVILANLPPIAQLALLERLHIPPRAMLVSGSDRAAMNPILTRLKRLGLRRIRVTRSGRYLCVVAIAR